jgi:hypothetical protein
MPIQIVSNTNANAVELRGLNEGVYYNACLSGQVNADDGDRVDIVNDVKTAAAGETVFEVHARHYTDFLDADGNGFADATAAADYVTAECHVIVGSGVRDVGPTQEMRFVLDQTHTSILLSDGKAFPVNSIKAVAGTDGHIEIWEHGDDGSQLYGEIYLANCYAAGALVPQTLAGAVNTLNALFTVSPVGAGGGFTPIYPTLAGVAVTPVSAGGIDPIGDNIFAGTSSSQHGARYRSTETINEPGEYFTFRQANHGQFIFGLGSVDNGDVAEFDAASGNGHSGFFYAQAMYDYGSYMAPWTTYGSNSGLSYGPGWSFSGNDPMFRYSTAEANMAAGNDALFKVGITDGGYVGAWYYDIDETNDWILLSRSTSPLPDGEYFFGLKISSTSSQLVEVPLRYATDPAAPTMGYRYIESPDGSFDYPLFATAEEAEWYDQNVASPAGSGQSQQVTYVDDAVTGSIWYRPVAGFTNDAASAPASTTDQAYTEIPTQADSLFAPSAPALQDTTVDENAAVNIQVAPTGALNYTVAVSGLPAGLSFDGLSVVQGTAPEVTGDNVANPSDVFTITVTNSNAYGSTSGTFDLTVTNLTQPVTPATGTTHVVGSTALVDSDTLDDGSAVTVDDTVAAGQRFVMDQVYVETNILPALTASGDTVYVGVQAGGATMGAIDDADFDLAIKWEWASSSSHTVTLLGNGLTSNALTISSLTDAVYDYAFELDNSNNLVAIGCNIGSINTEPAVSDGGSFTRTLTKPSFTGPATITFAVLSAQMDLIVGDLNEISIPAAPSNATSWTKALDFSGSSERVQQVVTQLNVGALELGGKSVTTTANATSGYTSDHVDARPWATAIVFKYDGNSSNQHIWNMGEGAGSTDDNIYLRLDPSGNLYFGWGRSGAINECKFLYLGTSINTNHWHGIYIAHDGTRLSGANATAANLADAFSIRWFTTNNGGTWGTWNTEYSTSANWSAGSTGARMDRQVGGDFTIGGRGSNRSFQGKVASMVVTTLERNVAMPANAEIDKMVSDPSGWLTDYKVGNSYRPPEQGNSNAGFSIGAATPAYSTQVWLMGDGTSDAYAKIRNQVQSSDQNFTALNMISMVSNDIETVTISGLS